MHISLFITLFVPGEMPLNEDGTPVTVNGAGAVAGREFGGAQRSFQIGNKSK